MIHKACLQLNLLRNQRSSLDHSNFHAYLIHCILKVLSCGLVVSHTHTHTHTKKKVFFLKTYNFWFPMFLGNQNRSCGTSGVPNRSCGTSGVPYRSCGTSGVPLSSSHIGQQTHRDFFILYIEVKYFGCVWILAIATQCNI